MKSWAGEYRHLRRSLTPAFSSTSFHDSHFEPNMNHSFHYYNSKYMCCEHGTRRKMQQKYTSLPPKCAEIKARGLGNWKPACSNSRTDFVLNTEFVQNIKTRSTAVKTAFR